MQMLWKSDTLCRGGIQVGKPSESIPKALSAGKGLPIVKLRSLSPSPTGYQATAQVAKAVNPELRTS